MIGGTYMTNLQSTFQRVSKLDEDDQNTVIVWIDQFINETKKKKSKISVGLFDGKYDIVDDIDFCNDEVATLFGVRE